MRSLFRPRASILAAVLAAACGAASAQGVSAGFDPRTGDAWVDTWLVDINRYGAAYRDPFIDELVRFHGAPRELVVELLRRPGWTPADVYFACALAAQIGRPCRYVVDEYERDRAAGWGALAQRLGVKPGSAEFHRLKRGLVPTYDRWGRPIQLDDELGQAFPGRARARASGASSVRDTPAPRGDRSAHPLPPADAGAHPEPKGSRAAMPRERPKDRHDDAGTGKGQAGGKKGKGGKDG